VFDSFGRVHSTFQSHQFSLSQRRLCIPSRLYFGVITEHIAQHFAVRVLVAAASPCTKLDRLRIAMDDDRVPYVGLIHTLCPFPSFSPRLPSSFVSAFSQTQTLLSFYYAIHRFYLPTITGPSENSGQSCFSVWLFVDVDRIVIIERANL